MKYIIAKLFHKNSFIRVKIYFEDNRTKTFYVVPKNGIIEIKDLEMAYKLFNDKIVYEDGIPTVYYNSECPVPLSLKVSNDEREMIEYNPKEFYAGLRSQIVATLVKLKMKQDTINMLLIGMFALTVIVVGVAYWQHTEIAKLQESLNKILGV